MNSKYKLQKGDTICLEDIVTVIEDKGDYVKFEYDNGDKNWVWKANIKKVYRNGKLVYGKTFINLLSE